MRSHIYPGYWRLAAFVTTACEPEAFGKRRERLLFGGAGALVDPFAVAAPGADPGAAFFQVEVLDGLGFGRGFGPVSRACGRRALAGN